MELAIYRYINRYGPAPNVSLAGLASQICPNVEYRLLAERLEDLSGRKYIDLRKLLGPSFFSYDEIVEIKAKRDFFYTGDFIVEIDPRGREYFERLEQRDEGLRGNDTVFISCGQHSWNEKELGKRLAAAVGEITASKGYFAEDQNSLDALSRHIFAALDRCSGFVAVMHRRGDVEGLNDDHHVRGSVWVEQEIAIAAFLTQVYGREFPVLLYVQRDIKREGVREQIKLNEIPFDDDASVLEDFRQRLRDGSFKPRINS
jgi:hypothetical protein